MDLLGYCFKAYVALCCQIRHCNELCINPIRKGTARHVISGTAYLLRLPLKKASKTECVFFFCASCGFWGIIFKRMGAFTMVIVSEFWCNPRQNICVDALHYIYYVFWILLQFLHQRGVALCKGVWLNM